LKIEDKKSKL